MKIGRVIEHRHPLIRNLCYTLREALCTACFEKGMEIGKNSWNCLEKAHDFPEGSQEEQEWEEKAREFRKRAEHWKNTFRGTICACGACGGTKRTMIYVKATYLIHGQDFNWPDQWICIHCYNKRQDLEDFYINDHLILRAEKGRINIYVGGEKFKTCKFLPIKIDLNDEEQMQAQAEARSIDELESTFGDVSQKPPTGLFIWEEMQAHASNLQVWAEHDYSTNLLHRSLAFPLLRKLTELGDETAARVFRREVKKRFLSGYPPVQEYLHEEGYLKFLSKKVLDEIRAKCAENSKILQLLPDSDQEEADSDQEEADIWDFYSFYYF